MVRFWWRKKEPNSTPQVEGALPARAARLILLAALLLVVAPQTLQMSLWLSLFALGLIGWRWQAERRGWPLPSNRLRLLVTLLGVVAVASSYHSLVGREAGTALLTLMLCLKLLELRSLRDAMLVVFLGYFLVTAGFLYSQSLFAGGYMLLTAAALTTALVALAHPGATLGRSLGYLRSASLMLAQAVPLMLLLFILFPRLNGPLWGLPHDAFSGKTGLSDQMQMGAISSLADSDAVAFRVQFEGPIPQARLLYWRGPVFWFTDGRSWHGFHSPQRRSSVPLVGLNELIHYTVTLEPHGKHWIFAIDLPGTQPKDVDVTPAFQLLRTTPVNTAYKYRIGSYTDYWADNLPNWQSRYGLRLPSGANPRSQALARSWRSEGLNDQQLVDRALGLFRNQPFIYTRQPPLLGNQPVDEFLFETQRGFCEHYAAAFTLLMRAAGVPARVVTGYQGGERNPVGNYLVVRQANAHAWSEVYLPEKGWTRVDPTAVIPPERIEDAGDTNRFDSTEPLTSWQADGDLLRLLSNSWDAINYQWELWVIGYNAQRQNELLKRLGLGGLHAAQLGLLLLALVGSLLGLYAGWMVLRRRARQDPLQRLYRRLREKLERAGVPLSAAEGPVALADRLNEQHPVEAEAVRPLLLQYAAQRYGANPSAQEQAELGRAIGRLRLKKAQREIGGE